MLRFSVQLLVAFLFLFCGKGICSSPVLLITLGSECDFTPKDLQAKAGGVIIRGVEDQMFEDNLLILDGEVDELYWFAGSREYTHVHLDTGFAEALDLLEEAIVALDRLNPNLPYINPREVGRFYDLLGRVDRVFRENGLLYWATCGTLLGVVRHRGLIPWDDDIDLSILEEDLPQLLRLKEALAEVGVRLDHFHKYNFYKISFVDGEPIIKNGKARRWTYPFIDLHPMREKEDRYVCASKIWRSWYPKKYFLKSELQFPLPELPFGPLSIPVPHNSEDCLDRVYGKDWNDVAYAGYLHKTKVQSQENQAKPVKVDLFDRFPPFYLLSLLQNSD